MSPGKELKPKTPKLRFPGFEGEWIQSNLQDLCTEFKSGYGITSERIAENGAYPVYGGNGFRGYTDSYTHDGYYLLIGRQGALCGNINRANGKSYISEHAIAVSANELSDTEWLAQRLDYLELNRLSESSAQPGLAVSKLLKLKIFVPKKEEQTKIASFLTAVDGKIRQLTRKKELLEQCKKGVMQKIFSQEIRFRDEEGKDYPEWQETQLGSVSQDIFYGMNSSAIPYDGENKYLRITDIDEESHLFKPNPLSSPDDKIEDKYILKKGDIVFARTGASVGKSYLYAENDGKLLYAGFLIKFSIIKADPKFVFDCTLTDNYKEWVKLMSMRSGQPEINAEEYKSFCFRIPAIPEQAKIASFLSSIDQKITLVANQLENMQTWKKGLLQKMFV